MRTTERHIKGLPGRASANRQTTTSIFDRIEFVAKAHIWQRRQARCEQAVKLCTSFDLATCKQSDHCDPTITSDRDGDIDCFILGRGFADSAAGA